MSLGGVDAGAIEYNPRMAHQTVRILTGLLVLTMVAGAASSPIDGTGEEKTNDLPVVELILRDDGGKVNGSIGFYFQSREPNGPWQVGEKTELPLLSPKLEGKLFAFETIHHK